MLFSILLCVCVAGTIIIGIFGHPAAAASMAFLSSRIFEVLTVKNAPRSRLRALLLVTRRQLVIRKRQRPDP